MNQPKQHKENCCMGGCGNINCDHCAEAQKEQQIISEKNCKHQFFKDRNPPECLNCQKTEQELFEEMKWIKEFEKTKFATGGGSSKENQDCFLRTL